MVNRSWIMSEICSRSWYTHVVLVFSTVLMDSWYASKSLLLYIENLDKTYYVPLKCNRLVDDSDAKKPYQRIDSLQWTEAEEKSGKRVKLHRFPRDHKVKVFRVASCSTHGLCCD